MTEPIGIRELRQDASRYVRRCADGESFVVTDRGRPVGVLASGWDVIRLHASELVDALVAAGRYPSRADALAEVVPDLVREMERSAVDAAIQRGYDRHPPSRIPGEVGDTDEWGSMAEQMDSAAGGAWDELDEW